MRSLSSRRLSAKQSYEPPPIEESGDASKYIEAFSLTPADKVFLALRVSRHERKANLIDQEMNLTDAIQGTGTKIVGHYGKDISGQDVHDPEWMAEVVRQARKAKANVILAESVDRFVRHPDFNAKINPDLQATDQQLKQLVHIAQGIRLMTHLSPDATPAEIRSYQRKRGWKYSTNKAGRKQKNSYRKPYTQMPNKFAKVKRLRDKGWSWGRIAKKVGRARSTVQSWYAKS